MKEIKIGIIQQLVNISNFGIKNRIMNLNRLKENFDKLFREEDLDLVILPEEFYGGNSYHFTNIPESYENSKAIYYLKKLAIEYKCCVSTVITCSLNNNEMDKRYNSIAIMIGRDGNIAGYQERSHVFEAEYEFIARGNNIKIIDFDFLKIGLIPGIDMLHPEIAQNLVLKGAEVLICSGLIPSLSKEAANHDLLSRKMKYCTISRAMENNVFAIWVNGIGEASHVADGSYLGESLVAGPLGPIKELSQYEELAVVTLSLDQIETVKKFVNII